MHIKSITTLESDEMNNHNHFDGSSQRFLHVVRWYIKLKDSYQHTHYFLMLMLFFSFSFSLIEHFSWYFKNVSITFLQMFILLPFELSA